MAQKYILRRGVRRVRHIERIHATGRTLLDIAEVISRQGSFGFPTTNNQRGASSRVTELTKIAEPPSKLQKCRHMVLKQNRLVTMLRAHHCQLVKSAGNPSLLVPI